MLYPTVTEVIRAGNHATSPPSSQRELVELSLLLKPPQDGRGDSGDRPRIGIFR
jgi:hypothetical protein